MVSGIPDEGKHSGGDKMIYEAKIQKEDNGYSVMFNVEGEEKQVKVYQDQADNDYNKNHILEMFAEILDFFGEQGSKHDKCRIRFIYSAGDNVSEKERKELEKELYPWEIE